MVTVPYPGRRIGEKGSKEFYTTFILLYILRESCSGPLTVCELLVIDDVNGNTSDSVFAVFYVHVATEYHLRLSTLVVWCDTLRDFRSLSYCVEVEVSWTVKNSLVTCIRLECSIGRIFRLSK